MARNRAVSAAAAKKAWATRKAAGWVSKAKDLKKARSLNARLDTKLTSRRNISIRGKSSKGSLIRETSVGKLGKKYISVTSTYTAPVQKGGRSGFAMIGKPVKGTAAVKIKTRSAAVIKRYNRMANKSKRMLDAPSYYGV